MIRQWLVVLSIGLACLGVSPLRAEERTVTQAADTTTPHAAFPNDPGYQQGTQYALDLINIGPAWQYTHGDPRVVVALIDTGIDFAHPELADHIHPDARTFFLQGAAQDESGHGTLTAGIIGAATHNDVGAAGIASNVQLLPIKVSPGSTRQLALVDDQLDATYDFQDPIRYAASPERNGTRVININFATSLDDPTERAAIEEATHSGVLVVAAAGNTGQERALFPAAYDCVLGVGAVDRNAQRANFSTYGLGVDLVAPGVSIYGADLRGAKGYSADDYGAASGTSFAAPHVTGVAALVFSVRPDLTAWDVREIMMRSAKDLGAPGFDAEYGYGLLDAGAALELARVWRADSGKELPHCTGERYRVYGSLYLDQNQNGSRDVFDPAFSEPYTATTTYVELYAQNGARRLDVTTPNRAGIFTFDVVYDPNDAPYIIKLQNSTFRQELFFTKGMAGPYDIDMASFPTRAVVISGALFVDTDNNGSQEAGEPTYTTDGRTTVTIDLYLPDGQTPLATATSDHAGNFFFYLAPLTTTVTYELRENIEFIVPRLTPTHLLPVNPTAPATIAYAIGLNPDELLVEGQEQGLNPTPFDLQVITHTGSLVLHWATPDPVRSDSVFEIAYATQPGGPYQTLAFTAFAQTTSYTLFALPMRPTAGNIYFAVRALPRNASQLALASAYSNEAVVATPAVTQVFLPVISR